MNELELRDSLLQHNLFELFRQQLIKDFESSGCNAEFANSLESQWDRLRVQLRFQIIRMGSSLPALLYRVDLSEKQIRDYGKLHPDLDFESGLAELIIKRILQKVIFKKTYNQK